MLTVLKPVLVYDRNMQMHLCANLPHCVTNLHSNLLSGISIFQILYLILASFKVAFILSPTFRIYHVLKLQRKIRRHHFSTNLIVCKFVTFCHWWSRNFLFCKGEPGVPRFFISYSLNIRAELFPSIHFSYVSHIPR